MTYIIILIGNNGFLQNGYAEQLSGINYILIYLVVKS